MTSLSREGLTIDGVARFASKTILNPVLAPAVAALFASDNPAVKKAINTVVARLPFCQNVVKNVIASFGSYRFAAYLAAGASLVLWANNSLNKWTLNNWTIDDSWDFDKEIVLVTGAAGGIGHNIIKQMMERNHKTTFVAVDYIGLKWTPPAGSKVHYYQCDLSNSAKIKELAARIEKEVGDPTVMVNNAGLCRGQTIMEGSYQDIEMTIRTNLIAPFLLCKEFLPAMVKRNHGHIVNISSLSSVFAPATVVDYAATKSGLASMTEGLQMELKYRHNAPKVRASLCIFGFIKTPLFKGKMNHPNFMMPLVHVDTVGKQLADVIYSGFASKIYLPGMAGALAMSRGGPDWFHRRILDKSQDTGVIFNQPDQKIDPNTGFLEKED